MNPAFFQDSPFRSPQWRAERVMQMLEHRPGPLKVCWYDDAFVRTYRNFLLAFLAAGNNEAEQHAAILQRPHAYHAHMLRYHPDSERRQVVEAWLLTNETYDEIAKRLATEPEVIEFYGNLFFDVRDRLGNKDWIAKIIAGPRECLVANTQGTMTEDQRGYLYKLFAFFGGPLVLDALVTAFGSTTMPQRPKDVSEWLDDSLAQLVRSRATTAAAILQIDKTNIVRLLKLAQRQQRAQIKSKRLSSAPPPLDDEYIKKMLAAVKSSFGGYPSPRPKELRSTDSTPATKPRVSERPWPAAGPVTAAVGQDAHVFLPVAAEARKSAAETTKSELDLVAI